MPSRNNTTWRWTGTAMQLAKKSNNRDLLDYTVALREKHEKNTSADARKEKGQVFTPPSVCRFMASLLTRVPDRFRLLDPGAGVGSLAAAVCERLLALRSPRQIEIHLYESDSALLPLLEETMRRCRTDLKAAGHDFHSTIHGDDFILGTRGRSDQRMLFDDDAGDEFDAVIMNPPYFKVGADSPHALAMGDAFRGNTNIYMLFMARAAALLRPDG